ncbi:hypothetical protein FACS189485_01300 [Spirochaetia bacterium]|nr:hypothetical protein FACS189485_01300 [Spirochaetia bacterium]
MNVDFTASIPLDDSHDVVVAGGGPAGCAAALAAARRGKRTLILEAGTALGGMGTLGLVPAWCPFSDKEKIIYRGIAQEIFEDVKQGMAHIKKDAADWVPIDPEYYKRVLDKKVSEAGVDVLFGQTVISAAVDVLPGGQKRVSHIAAAYKGSLRAYAANVFIDSTGDADLTASAGFPTLYGDGETEEVQPATHCFMLSNVDEYHYHSDPVMQSVENLKPVSSAISNSGKYPLFKQHAFNHSPLGPGTVGFNAGHLWQTDPRDPYAYSASYMRGRELAHQLHEGLKEYLPHIFGASFLAQTAPAMGIRESRRIVGDYTLTVEDYLGRKTFSDEIGRNCYYLDVHLTEEESERVLAGKKVKDGSEQYMPGESHGLPRGMLAVAGAQNLLAAGRNVSCDRRVQGSIRVMPVCLVMGQAAGTWAALAGKGKDLREVEAKLLQTELKKDGAFFSS